MDPRLGLKVTFIVQFGRTAKNWRKGRALSKGGFKPYASERMTLLRTTQRNYGHRERLYFKRYR